MVLLVFYYYYQYCIYIYFLALLVVLDLFVQWANKISISKEFALLNQEFIAAETHRYTEIIFSIAASGLFSSSLLITDYSITGVMKILSSEEPTNRDWHEVYCVLSENCILIFESSRSKDPTGVIILKFASVYVHHGALRSGRFIFVVQTLLRKYYITAKHEVALAEWLCAIEQSMSASTTQATTSISMLRKIFAVAWEDQHLVHILGPAFVLFLAYFSCVSRR